MSLPVLYGTILGLIGLCTGVFVYVFHAREWRKALREAEEKIDKVVSHRKSAEVRLGKIGENLAPFIKDWPYNPDNFRFLGYPVDGIQLDEDAVILIEIKTGGARLSKSQKRIKQLVSILANNALKFTQKG